MDIIRTSLPQYTGSGRTRRMLEAAVEAAETARNVFVVAVDGAHARELKSRLIGLGLLRGRYDDHLRHRDGCKVWVIKETDSWNRPLNSVTFVDHAVEDRA